MREIAPSSFVSLLEKPLPVTKEWIGPNILPQGGKLLFGGQAAIGKSLIMLELARALSTGPRTRPFNSEFFYTTEQVRVLVCEQELGEHELQSRGSKIFDDIEAISNTLFYVTKQPTLKLDTIDGFERMQKLLEQVRPNVLILDPISKFMEGNEDRASDVSSLLSRIDALMNQHKERHMSVMFSHHFRKPSFADGHSTDPLDPYNFRGSSKWYDDPDTRWTLQKLQHPTKKHAWRLKRHIVCRTGPSIDAIYFAVNEHDNLRVVHIPKPYTGKNGTAESMDGIPL